MCEELKENIILSHDDYMETLRRLEADAKGEEFIDGQVYAIGGFDFECLRNLVDAYDKLLVDYDVLEIQTRAMEYRLDQKVNECLKLRKENKELRIEIECMYNEMHKVKDGD